MSAFSWSFMPIAGGYRTDRPLHQAASIAQSHFLPEGAYTTMRTVGGTGILRWRQHLDRLEETTALLGAPQRLERDALQQMLCELLQELPWAGSSESRVRLTVTTDGAGRLWLSVEALTMPSEAEYRDGVAVLTRPLQRDNARAKNSAFIAQSEALRALREGPIHEVLMVGAAGTILEGIDSNFFAVVAGRLYTADEGVLAGVTREMVLQEAHVDAGPVVLAALPLAALPTISEAFISSTSRAILPVTEIDGRAVGNGRPGPITLRLMRRLQQRLYAETTEMCPM